MRITAKKGKGDKIHISAGGEYFCTVNSVQWYSSGYSDGDELNSEELADLKGEAGFRLAYESAVRMLSLRAHGTRELERKLCRKYDADSVERAVACLDECGYLNDEAYAESLAKELFEKKKWDVKRIEKELVSRGIEREIVNITLESLDNDPVSRIIILLDTRLLSSLNDSKGIRRATSTLIRMGYSPADIRKAMRERGINSCERKDENW